MMKSLAFVVVIDRLAENPPPFRFLALPSKGEAILAPVIPKATAAASKSKPLVMVMAVDVLDDGTAYQVSILTNSFVRMVDDLKDHVSVGVDVIELTGSPFLNATTTYRRSLILDVESVIEIVFPELSADVDPSKARAGFN